VSAVKLPCRVRLPDGAWRAAILVDRYWIEGQGWVAVIEDDGRGMLGMQGTTQVPLNAVEPVAGVDYSVIKPRWWVWRQTGYVPEDHPPGT
jgi:hypothetical protein